MSRAVWSYKFGDDRNSELNYYAAESLSCFKGEATTSVFLGINCISLETLSTLTEVLLYIVLVD